MGSIEISDITNLLRHFSKNTYYASQTDETSDEILQRCDELMSIDYTITKISNADAYLSANYPKELLIPEQEITSINENPLDAKLLRQNMHSARYARCRTRLPVPVINYKNKFICRSATLSGGAEICGRIAAEKVLLYGSHKTDGTDDEDENEKHADPSKVEIGLWDTLRFDDIKLLGSLNVSTIVDLMVEKKKVKYWMNVSSSEKVDKEARYIKFNLISLPYPGCEFFKDYRDNNYCGEGLVFDWSQPFVDTALSIPQGDPIASKLDIEWHNYSKWDLITVTQNYIKFILHYIKEGTSGILIHCISGWDRTPLFISLLRILLWADGLIHKNLNVYQMLYLTIAYDWFLFGHHLRNRLVKGEDIFFFCFNSLKYFTDDEFSINPASTKIKSPKSSPNTKGSPVKTDSPKKDEADSKSSGSPVKTDSPKKGLKTDSESNGSPVKSYSPKEDFKTEPKSNDSLVKIDSRTEDLKVDPKLNGSPVKTDSALKDLKADPKECGTSSSHSPQKVQKTDNSSTERCSSRADTQSDSSFEMEFMENVANLNITVSPERNQPKPSITVDAPDDDEFGSPSSNASSPISLTSPRRRVRHDSCSPDAGGSWQMVSTTGSFRGSTGSLSSLLNSELLAIDEDKEMAPPLSPHAVGRKERLRKLRELFSLCYGPAVGLKFVDGSDTIMGAAKASIRDVSDVVSQLVGRL